MWKHAVGREDKFNVKTACVCSKHFVESDFPVNLKHQLLNYRPKNYRGLKEDAVPIQNLPHPSKNDNNLREARFKKRQQKQVIDDLLSPSCGSGDRVISNSNAAAGEGVAFECAVDEASANIGVQTDVTSSESEINSLKLLVEEQKKIIAGKDRENFDLQQSLSCVESVLSKNQLAKLRNKKRITWNASEISNAIVLYSAGPRAYRLMLKKGYPYPAVSTLRSWLRKIHIVPGILSNVFKLIDSSHFGEKDKICILSFDEMKIRKEYIYDRVKDEVLKPYSYVQVVMMSGLFKSWKQPIFYDYDKTMTSECLLDVIKFVECSGFQVVAMVSDLGGGNRGLHRDLNITYSKPYFYNPFNNEKIFVFADVPHLLKLIRNNFVDHGFLINGKEVSKNIIETVLDVTGTSDLKITYKITKEKLNVKGAQRQRVKFAAKLFSHTVSRAISRCGTLGFLPSDMNWSECSDFFDLVNNWFDVFNVSVPISDARYRNRAYGLAIQEQDEVIDRMTEVMLNIRVKGRTHLLPFQNGILMSNNSLKCLLVELKRRFDSQYILTRRLNQDVLENFFGIIRANGGLHDHPNALEFKYRLRSCILGKNNGNCFSDFSNVEADDTPDLPISGQIINKVKFEQNSVEEINNDETMDIELQELEYDGLENLAGFICYRLKDSCIISNNDENYSWTNHLSEGNLVKPSSEFMEQMEELEKIFRIVNGDSIVSMKGFIKNLIDRSSNVKCSMEAKKLFFRSRMYFRLREMNKTICTFNFKKRKFIKTVT